MGNGLGDFGQVMEVEPVQHQREDAHASFDQEPDPWQQAVSRGSPYQWKRRSASTKGTQIVGLGGYEHLLDMAIEFTEERVVEMVQLAGDRETLQPGPDLIGIRGLLRPRVPSRS